jgi:hypothetical protein
MPPLFKFLVLGLLASIVVSLGKALFHMSSGPSQSGEMVTALSWRIGMSLVLFVLLLGGYWAHLISPHAGP